MTALVLDGPLSWRRKIRRRRNNNNNDNNYNNNMAFVAMHTGTAHLIVTAVVSNKT